MCLKERQSLAAGMTSWHTRSNSLLCPSDRRFERQSKFHSMALHLHLLWVTRSFIVISVHLSIVEWRCSFFSKDSVPGKEDEACGVLPGV